MVLPSGGLRRLWMCLEALDMYTGPMLLEPTPWRLKERDPRSCDHQTYHILKPPRQILASELRKLRCTGPLAPQRKHAEPETAYPELLPPFVISVRVSTITCSMISQTQPHKPKIPHLRYVSPAQWIHHQAGKTCQQSLERLLRHSIPWASSGPKLSRLPWW